MDLEIEGPAPVLEEFLARLPRELPPLATVRSLASREVAPEGETDFRIRPSQGEAAPTVLVLPDLATCPACLAEVMDPRDRRHRYPFANCTLCGPRYSILQALPYDRPATTMRGFPLCSDCRAEYGDPRDRRFHAQPVACPACGPRLSLWDSRGGELAQADRALLEAARALREGALVAVKSLGGFQLLVDARDGPAVARLRQRKGRESKPLAILAPDLEWAARTCRVGPEEERLLRSPAAPIVLMATRDRSAIAPEVAPGTPRLGVMLPFTPLHHLLARELGFPVVATSGNASDEPLCVDEAEALERLGQIADLFLVHDRPIARPVDDSVVQVVEGREQVLRRARGYAPLPLPLPEGVPTPPPILAVGGHLKGSVALTVGREVVVSQHLGDLETRLSRQNFEATVQSLSSLFRFRPERVACDLHPDYASTAHARGLGLPVLPVQHHEAHVYAGMLDSGLVPPVMGVAWDGTGYGPDGTIWGGEFFAVGPEGCRRLARLRRFRLPGGEVAVREPRRAALGLLHALDPDLLRPGLAPVDAFQAGERKVLVGMLERGVRSPWTSSAGRLFDAVSALVGLRQRNLFEGQAAMELEACLEGEIPCGEPLALPLREGEVLEVDWAPAVRAVLDGLQAGLSTRRLAEGFHLAMAGAVATVANRVGLEQVVLTGGCFQNVALTGAAAARLRGQGFRPSWQRNLPPNDGGLAAGQAYAALLGPGIPGARP